MSEPEIKPKTPQELLAGHFAQLSQKPYLGGLDSEEKTIITNAIIELNRFINQNREQYERQFLESLVANHGDIRLYTLILYTRRFLAHTAELPEAPRILAFIKEWNNAGFKNIVEGLKVRYNQATEITDSEIIDLEPELDIPVDSGEYALTDEGEEEEAPITQRVRYAKVLRYINIFYKTATGKL